MEVSLSCCILDAKPFIKRVERITGAVRDFTKVLYEYGSNPADLPQVASQSGNEAITVQVEANERGQFDCV